MGKQPTDLRLSSYRRQAGSRNQRRRYQRRPVAASSARRSIMEGRAGNCIARPQPNGNRHQCDEGEGISRQQRPGTTGALEQPSDRKSVVEEKSVSVRVDLGGRRIINKK